MESVDIAIEWREDKMHPGVAYPASDAGYWVSGCPVHVMAFQVYDDDKGVQHGSPTWDTEVDGLQTCANGRVAAVELPGLEGRWTVAMLPHGD